MNDNNLNLNNDLTENDFFLRIDNLTKDLSSNELLMLSDYISQKAKISNSSADNFNGLTILYGSQTVCK